jgi:hypothetical protein
MAEEECVSVEGQQELYAALPSRCTIKGYGEDWFAQNPVGVCVHTKTGPKYSCGSLYKGFCDAEDFRKLFHQTPVECLAQAAAEVSWRRASPGGSVPPPHRSADVVVGKQLFAPGLSSGSGSDLTTENTSVSSVPSQGKPEPLQNSVAASGVGGTSGPVGGASSDKEQALQSFKRVRDKVARMSGMEPGPHVAVALALEKQAAEKRSAKKDLSSVATVPEQALPKQTTQSVAKVPNPAPLKAEAVLPWVGAEREEDGELRIYAGPAEQWVSPQRYHELHHRVPTGYRFDLDTKQLIKSGTRSKAPPIATASAGPAPVESKKSEGDSRPKVGDVRIHNGGVQAFTGVLWATPQECYVKTQVIPEGFSLSVDTWQVERVVTGTRREGSSGPEFYGGSAYHWLSPQRYHSATGLLPRGFQYDAITKKVVPVTESDSDVSPEPGQTGNAVPASSATGVGEAENVGLVSSPAGAVGTGNTIPVSSSANAVATVATGGLVPVLDHIVTV